jgi:class 3 adenylate cyclase
MSPLAERGAHTRTGKEQCGQLERLSMTHSLEIPSESRERTILTTDIVGSTGLLRRFPNDMMGAMDLHDQILHTSIRRHSGDPFRSTGDGVLAAFDRPVDAVMDRDRSATRDASRSVGPDRPASGKVRY